MSSPQIPPSVVSSLLATEYCLMATLSLAIYDWLIHFDDEIRCFWTFRKGRKITAAALLYWSGRYLLIIQIAFSVRTISPMSDSECNANLFTQLVAGLLLQLVPPIFSALRVYALSGRSKVSAVVTLLLLTIPVVLNAVEGPFYHATNLPAPFNCSAMDETPDGLKHRVVLVAKICAMAGDAIVLGVTWRSTYALYRMQRELGTRRQSVVSVMLYNGSVYFIAITAYNVFEIVFTLWSQVSQNIKGLSAISDIDDVFTRATNILISHFLLDLRKADRESAGPSSSTLSAVNSIRFEAPLQTASLPAFIASMGESIHMGLETVPETEEETENEARILGI